MTTITRYLRIGEEETAFATETSAYAETLDPEKAELDPESDDKLIYEGMGGLDRTVGLGTYSTSGDIAMPLDDAATVWFWKWALGGYEVTGTTPDFTHSITPDLGNLMTSFSAAIGKDFTEHVFLGNVVDSIKLEVSDEWALMTVSVKGAKDKKAALTSPIEYTDGNMFTAPQGKLVRDPGGVKTDMSADVNSATLTVSVNANVEDSSGFGSRFPTKATRGSLLVTLEMELEFQDTTELENFWGDATGPSIDNIEESDYTMSFGDNIDFIFGRMVFTSAGQPASGRDSIKQSLTARGLYDSLDGSGPLEVSVTNTRESYKIPTT